MRSIISLIAFSTLTTGCVDLGYIKLGADTAADDTAGTDTAGESEDSGTDTATDTAVEEGTAEIRFLNLRGSATLHATDGSASVEQTLSVYSGSAFQEVSAGTYELFATSGDTELSRSSGVHLRDGGHYSVAYTPAGDLLVTETDEEGLESNHTRITYINVEADSSVTGDLTYYSYTSGLWEGPGRIFELAPNESFVDDFAYITTAAKLLLTFEGLDSLEVDWNTAAYMQVEPGTSVNVYFWNDGDCSSGSSSCEPQIFAQYASGRAASVDHVTDPGFGW